MYGDDTRIHSEGQYVYLYKILPKEREQQLRGLMLQLEGKGYGNEVVFIFIATAVSCLLKNWSVEDILDIMLRTKGEFDRLEGGDSGAQ